MATTRKRTAIAVNTHSRAHLHQSITLGERVADQVASVMGSWKFIIIQSVVVFLWITINAIGWSLHWDPYPFILLNLAFSTQAAYTGPILQMTGNRAAARDKLRDDHEAKEVDELFKIQLEQVKILNQQTEILQLLKAMSAPPPPPDSTLNAQPQRTMKAVRS